MKNTLVKMGIPLLSVIFVAIFPSIFLYGNNSNEASIQDVLFPMLLFVTVALVLFVIFVIVSRNPYKSGIVTIMFMLVLENFAALEGILLLIFPNLYYWHTTAIFLFILLHVAFIIYKFLPQDLAKTISSVLCLVFSGLVVVNGLVAIPGEINKINAKKLEEEKQQQAEQIGNLRENEENLPNIYLLIFDEFAGFHQMEKYYNYDNKILKDFLQNNKFTISYDSHNESIMTATITTNLVNLDYVVDDNTSAAESQIIRENGTLFDMLEEKGYAIRKLTTNSFYGEGFKLDNITYSNNAVTATGDNLENILLKNSILYPMIQPIPGQELKIFEFLSKKDNIPQEPTFTLAHTHITHTPFYYDEKGSIIPASKWNDWKDKSVYLGTYKFTSKLMIEVLSNLTVNDPNSLIIVMSDHGARASTDQELYMKVFELNDINNIFNAFYYNGIDLSEYTGLSSLNTLRKLLNLAIGTNYEILEAPNK